MLLQMHEFIDAFKENPEKWFEFDEVKDFISVLLTFPKQMNDVTAHLNEVTDKIMSALKSQGIDLG